MEETFEVLQLARSSSTGSAIARMAARMAASDNVVTELVREQQDAIAQQQSLDDLLIKTLGAPSEQRNETQEANLRKQLKSLQNRIQSLSEKITSQFPEYAELTRREPVSLKETQSLSLIHI